MLPLADLELRWPPALFASEAAALGNAPDAGTQNWQDRVERLLEEAFTGTAAREHMTRAGRGIAPTEAGHALAATIAQHVDALEHAVHGLRPGVEAEPRPVFLGAPGDVLAELVLARLTGLLAANMAFRCHLSLPGHLVRALLKDELDIAILTKIEGVPTKQLFLLHWLEEQFLLIGPAGSAPFEPGKDPRRFIGYSDSMPMARRYFRECWQLPPPAPALTVPDMRGVVRAVRVGLGLAVVPDYLAAEALDRGEVEVVHTPREPVVNSLYLALRRGREQVPQFRTVLSELMG